MMLVLVPVSIKMFLTACRNLKFFVENVGGRAYKMAVHKGRELVEPAKEKLFEFAKLVKFAVYFFAAISAVALVKTVLKCNKIKFNIF